MSNTWSDIHKKYAQKEWSTVPSIFATQAIEFFPKEGSLLELGCGVGQDALYFSKKGYDVTATDLFVEAINQTLSNVHTNTIKLEPIDLQAPLPYSDASYDVVYAHLSLHYFDQATTQRIFDDIARVLKPGGVLAVFANSISDPEYGSGERLEKDYYFIDGFAKRYFSVETLKPYLRVFDIELLDANGETYKDAAVGVHHLIRAIARKPLSGV